MFEQGEIVVVSDRINAPNTYGDDFVFVQKFVVFYKGVYYCERDDGKKGSLIGWKNCRKMTEDWEYHHISHKADSITVIRGDKK